MTGPVPDVANASHGDSNNNAVTNGIAWTHNVATTGDLVVFFSSDDNTIDYSAATVVLNATTIPFLTKTPSAGVGRFTAAYFLQAVAPGSYTISITSVALGSSPGFEGDAVTINGNDPVTPIKGSPVVGVGSSLTASIGVPSAVNNTVIVGGCYNNADTGVTLTAPATVIVQHAEAGVLCAFISQQPGSSGTVTTSWVDTGGSANAWGGIAISFQSTAGVAVVSGSIIGRQRPIGRGPHRGPNPRAFRRPQGSNTSLQILLQLFSAPGVPLANTLVNFCTALNEESAAVDGNPTPISLTTDASGFVLLNNLLINAKTFQVRAFIPGDPHRSSNFTVASS